jgi:hypothetical protein
MNRHRRYVLIPDTLVKRGLLWGEKLVAHYAAGGSPQSRAVSGDRGTEKDPLRQARGKIGEVAVAILFGKNPLTDMKWNLAPDQGSDIRSPSGLLVDVKTTFPPYKLIWSRTINDLYHQKMFDALVSVSIDSENYSKCWVEGWISKENFFKEKQIADGINSGLEKGTWFVDKVILSSIDDLLAQHQQAFVEDFGAYRPVRRDEPASKPMPPPTTDEEDFPPELLGFLFEGAAVSIETAAPEIGTPALEQHIVERPHAYFDDKKRFIHNCSVCGKDAGFGVGVSLLKDQLGTWFCLVHWREWKATQNA